MQSNDAVRPARPAADHGGFTATVTALTRALGTRLAPGITTFPDLFTEDGVIEVPFDGGGGAAPVVGRAAVAAMVSGLDGVLHFHEVTVTGLHDIDESTVVCEYHALLERVDLHRRHRRRYISLLELRGGRIALLREHGGPLLPAAG